MHCINTASAVRRQPLPTRGGQNPKADDPEGAGLILRVLAASIDRLPGDEHGHDRGFTAASGHFQG